MASPRMPRKLDHLVLPVPDLEVARKRHQALGFIVDAEARHPFGTENACIFFADGTYLEPLATASREECEAAAVSGNVFVARDRAFRFRQGENGLSAVVVASADAAADDARFRRRGMSGGEMLTFSRPLSVGAGKSVEASFRLAFAADLRAPDFFAFAVERVKMPAGERGALTEHPNGITEIAQIVLSEPNPSDFQYFLQEVADNREVEAHSFGMEIALEGATLNVMTPEGMQVWFGRKASTHARGLRGRAVVFRVGDLDSVEALLKSKGVLARRMAGRLLVDEAPGQGAIYGFEESK